MRFDPDRLLLEHVFQRLTRLLSSHGSCYDLARGCVFGAGVFTACAHVQVFIVRGILLGVLFFAFDLLMAAGLLSVSNRIAARERDTACGRIYDPYSISERHDRYFYLISIIGILVVYPFGSFSLYFMPLVMMAWASAVYFVSCMPHTPSRQAKTYGLIPSRSAS